MPVHRRGGSNPEPDDAQLRLQVYLARAGVASRRSAEKLIASGRVEVNGCVVTRMGVKISHDDEIRVDGTLVQPETRRHYLALHKPLRVISSASDERGRAVVTDFIPATVQERLFPVGRLDYETSGLILLTNDGNFARIALHPSFEIEKEYRVTADSEIPAELFARFEQGLSGPDGVIYRAKRVRRTGDRRALVVLTEGKNREIRRAFAAMGLGIEALQRVRIGPVELGALKPGYTRPLTQRELAWFLYGERDYKGGSRH